MVTACGASRRPVTSSHSVTGRKRTSATLTLGAGMAAAWVAAGLFSQPASSGKALAAKRPASIAPRQVRVTRDDTIVAERLEFVVVPRIRIAPSDLAFRIWEGMGWSKGGITN